MKGYMFSGFFCVSKGQINTSSACWLQGE